MANSCDHAARNVPRTATAALGVGAASILAHALPSTLILPTFSPRQFEAWGSLCRWRTPSRDGVAITFDDGPDVDTLRTLDLLEELDMRATFFVLGSQVQSHPAIAKEIVARGHEVGTHGFAHRHHLLSTPRAIKRDLDRAIALHGDVLGTFPRFFRPPYGQLALSSVLAARHHGLQTVLWSAWGREWAEFDPAAVFRRLDRGVQPGAIVLLHDNEVSCPPWTGDRTRAVLRPLASLLHARRLRSATLSELLEVDRPADRRQKSAA